MERQQSDQPKKTSKTDKTCDSNVSVARVESYPDSCAECNKRLLIGLAYFMFACHTHAICENCDRSANRVQGECYYCWKEEEVKAKQEQEKSLETKNSLPILAMSKSKAIKSASPSLRFQYPALHPTPSLMSFTYTGPITLSDKANACWSSGYMDSVIVGGRFRPSLRVVSHEGVRVQHIMTQGRRIMSGALVLVKQWLYLVCVDYTVENKDCKIHLIHLDPITSISSYIQPLLTLDVQNPLYLFSISKQLHGVLCMYGSIRILSLTSLILPKDTDPRTIQCTAVWGRRTLLHLDLPYPSDADTVVVTPRGLYCVASEFRSEVRVYSRAGVYMYTLGENTGVSDPVNPGFLLQPTSIQCTSDNKLVITGDGGDVQSYDLMSKTGSLVKRKFSKDMLGYLECESDEEEKYEEDGKRRVYMYMKNPAGWQVVSGVWGEKFVWCGAMSRARRWFVDHNRKNILHTYNVNT